MKKFALIAATLICFAGCARNDTGDMGATETTDSGTGASASGQIGTDSASTPSEMDTNSISGSSTLSSDTNSLEQPTAPQTGGDTLSTPPPQPPAAGQDEQQPQPNP